MVWINGKFEDEESAGVSVRDTGLLHAAGVFTTMRSYGGQVFRLRQHLDRLRRSCQALAIPLQYDDRQLEGVIADLHEQNGLIGARLRLTVTRGRAGQERTADAGLTPTVLLSAADLTPYPEEFYRRGMTAAVEDQQKLNPYDIQAGHKTLNYFSRLAALRTANQRGAGEALWFDVHNHLQSGSISNVFVVKSGKVTTPPTQDELATPDVAKRTPYPRSAVLPGITRAAVVELAKNDHLAVEPGPIDINALLAADEVFITNSIMGVMPVCRIERKAIANDKPGPVTVKLMDRYAALVESECG